MSALPRPDLAPGPARELNDALHELHHRAGWPSLRTLAHDAGCSHTTVSHVFSSPKLPTWGVLELLVEAMAGSTSEFHDLWLAASAPSSNGSSPPPRIAGRRTELVAVRRHLETGSGLLLVTGEAGIGKTKLVTTAAAGADAFVATGTCRPLSTEVPLLPVSELFRQVLREDAAWFEQALNTSPDFVREAMAQLLPELGAIGPAGLSEEWARQRLFHAISALLGGLRRSRPLGVLIEDGHWGDATTLDLIELQVGQPGSVVMTWRTDDPDIPASCVDWLARVRRSPDADTLALGPLTPEETAEQLTLLGGQVHTREGVQRIHDRSLGQPLFTEQLALHPNDRPLPELLADLLQRRLRTLSPDGWRVARALGVADRPLLAEQLTLVTELDPVPVLRELDDQRLLGADDGPEVSLRHPLVADAIRARLAPGEAPGVHRAVAGVLAVLPHPPAAEIAQHWAEAGDIGEELPWRIEAARSSAAGYATAIEAEQWLRALQIWPSTGVSTAGTPPVSRAEAYLAAMDALRSSMQFDRAAAMSDEAEIRLTEIDLATRAELLWRAAYFRAQREGIDVGLTLLEEAMSASEELPVSAATVRALDRKHVLLRAAGRNTEAFELARVAAEVAEQVGDPQLLRARLQWVAWHECISGSAGQAARTMARADSLVPANSDPQGDVRRAEVMTDMLLATGGSADVIETAGQIGLAVAERWGIETHPVAIIRSNIVTGMIHHGRIADAATLVDSRSEGPVDIDRWPIHLDRALLDALRGHGDQALARLTSLLGAFEGHRIIGDDLEFVGAVATCYLWNNAPSDAWSQLLPALDSTVEAMPAGLTRPALLLAAWAAADIAESDASVGRGHLAALVELHSRLPTPETYGQRLPTSYARALSAGWDAELARLAGNAKVERWVTAATSWDHLDRPHDAAYCRWRGAQVALREGQGNVAARLLKRAAADAREHVPLTRAIAATGAS